MKNTITLQLLIGFALLSSCLGLLNFPSSYVEIPESGLKLYFEVNEGNSSILLGLDIAQDVDYFAVGFADRGNYGMTTFDIVAITFAASQDPENPFTVGISDLYSTEKRRPPADTSLNGTSDYFLVDSYATTGRRQALFVRALDTKDKYDYKLDPSQTRYGVVMNWAYVSNGKGTVGYHSGNRGTVIAPLYNGFQGKAESYTPGGFWTPAMIFALHGYIMLFGWGFLADVALQIARYGKSNRFYMTIHSCIMTLLYTLTGVASGFALYLNWGTITGAPAWTHYIGGVIIFILLTLQAAFGMLLGIKITREKLTKVIPSLSKSHAVGGVLLYVLTKAQLVLGLYMYKQSYLPYLLAYFLVLFTFRAAQEYRYRKKDILGAGNHKIASKEDSFNESHRKLMALLNNNTPVSEILQDPELKDLKWAVFEDKVFAINKFDHPGGNFILKEINGQEISRFIYGAYGLFYPPNFTQHAHTKHALEIMEKNFIGTIQNGQNVLLAKDEFGTSTLVKDHNLNPSSIDTSEIKSKLVPVNIGNGASNWILANKKQITSSISKFEFKCRDYQISSSLHDIRHLGRHMRISHASLPKNRLYTLVLSQTDYRIKRRDLLWKRVVKKNSSLVDFTNMAPCETLPLIIKNYNLSQAFSTLVHDAPLGEAGFSIEGPYGLGFGLTPESTGLHVIFAAGTGILPFIDLFDYLLEGVIDESAHVQNLFKNGFKLHVYASFMTLADFVGLDICEKLAEALNQNGLNDAFRLIIKASKAHASEFYQLVGSDFNANFIRNNFDFSCQKVYICGPPKFNDSIPQELKDLGFPSERIVLA